MLHEKDNTCRSKHSYVKRVIHQERYESNTKTMIMTANHDHSPRREVKILHQDVPIKWSIAKKRRTSIKMYIHKDVYPPSLSKAPRYQQKTPPMWWKPQCGTWHNMRCNTLFSTWKNHIKHNDNHEQECWIDSYYIYFASSEKCIILWLIPYDLTSHNLNL